MWEPEPQGRYEGTLTIGSAIRHSWPAAYRLLLHYVVLL